MSTVINEMLQAIITAFTTVGQAILTLVKNGFIWLFCEYSEVTTDGVTTYTPTGLSPFAYFVFVLMSIAIVMSLTAFITNLVRRSR